MFDECYVYGATDEIFGCWNVLQNFLFFAKDVIISIFHHCEIRICYLGRSRLSFTRTSMKWKIIGVKMKIFSIRCGFCCHFCYLFLPMIKCDKICLCIYPPAHSNVPFIFNRATKYHVNENFKVSRKRYTKILLLFNLVHFSMISFSFHFKFWITETKYAQVVKYFLKLYKSSYLFESLIKD